MDRAAARRANFRPAVLTVGRAAEARRAEGPVPEIPLACGFVAERHGCALASCLRTAPCPGVPHDLAVIMRGGTR